MSANETKTSEPTPEQLLKMLDLQMSKMRSKRANTESKTTIRVASILLVLTVAAGALFFLMTMLEDLRSQRASGVQNTGINADR